MTTTVLILLAGSALFLVAFVRTSRVPSEATGSGGIAAVRPLVLLAAIAALVLTYSTLLSPGDSTDFLRGEDGPVESAGAIALLVSSVLFLLAFVRSKSASPEAYGHVKRTIVLLLALAFLFGAGEEISWGQRILGLEAPAELREANYQGETNLHNLAALGEGRFALHNLFKMFWFTFAVLVPVGCALSARVQRTLGGFMPILPLWLAALFLANGLLAELGRQEFGFGSDAVELGETNLAILFIVAAYAVLSDASRASARQASGPRTTLAG